MRERFVIVDQTVGPGLEVSHGPGIGRKCAYGPCERRLHPDDPPSKRYHHPKCRTADWKARRASEQLQGMATVLRAAGDAENASKRAVELRELRKHGPVASDRRVQASRATESVTALLIRLGVESKLAGFYAQLAIHDALPERFRR